MRLFRPWFAAIGLFFAACGEALAPSDVAGSYHLSTVDGSPPNARAYPTSSGCSVRYQDATLDLLDDGQSYLYVYRAQACPTDSTYVDFVLYGHYAIRGAAVELRGGADSMLTATLRGTHLLALIPNPVGATPDRVELDLAPGASFLAPARPINPPHFPLPARHN